MAGYRAFGDLKAEAEYRVRRGQSRADVSRELGVPLPMLGPGFRRDERAWRDERGLG